MRTEGLLLSKSATIAKQAMQPETILSTRRVAAASRGAALNVERPAEEMLCSSAEGTRTRQPSKRIASIKIKAKLRRPFCRSLSFLGLQDTQALSPKNGGSKNDVKSANAKARRNRSPKRDGRFSAISAAGPPDRS